MKIRQILCLLIVCNIFIIPVSANHEVTQGDTVYIGEHVDISRVLSWSMKFAYWASGEPEDDYPQRVVEVTGFMYNYYIDPTKFVPGTWYKWDGHIDRAGNMLAFYVKEGKRPADEEDNMQLIEERGTTKINASETPKPLERTHPKDTEILIARGDEGMISYEPESDVNLTGATDQRGFIWLFGGDTKIMGVPMNYSKKDGINSYQFKPTETERYSVGEYKGYIQFVGKNGKQDVFYDKTAHNLDSIYKKVEPINIDPYIPSMILTKFENLSKNKEYCDDYLVPIKMYVEEPMISITDFGEAYDDLIIEGTTTLSNATRLKIQVDPDHYVLEKDILQNTYYAQTQGTVKTVRKFLVSVPLNWGELDIGQHKVVVSIDKYKIHTTMEQDFPVTGVWVNPTPTLIFRKVIVDKYGTHVVDESGNLVSTKYDTEEIYNVSTTEVVTARPTMTPPILQTIPPATPRPVATPVPTTTDDVSVPLNPLLAVGAIISVWRILTRDDD